jgi:poly-gamma-glutamate synthase PgsB/CapB
VNAAELSVVVLAALTVGVFAYWRVSIVRHQRRMNQLHVRVHVNGIRGKSSVTRLVAGVLREGGYVTVAKTTGSAARVIGPHGEESPIKRRGAPTINEQVDIVREHVGPSVEALIIECMAVRPLYQEYSQEFIVRSDITIITNVREDHQEEMGETLEEIADSMSVTIPRNGVLVTAENRAHLRERLERNAAARGSRCLYADPRQVLDEDLRGFDYLQFKDNVAIGLTMAKLLGIDRDTALRGMWKSVPDVGVVRLRTYDVRGKRILWVPMFAANDRESVIVTFELLQAYFPEGATVIGILNNRLDRGRRAELFATMVPQDLAPFLDHVITFGAYEDTVTASMVGGGYPADRIHNLGESLDPSLDTILDSIAGLVDGTDGVLVGMVNIHTAQAEMLIHHFAELLGPDQDDELSASRDPARLPVGTQRVHRAASRPTGRTADRNLPD